ncbi:MAG TPA: hypothetical protein DCZ71_02475, partial [Ruminococcus sp.]|nr:hypothetical protein [Ruminococcus sp.]
EAPTVSGEEVVAAYKNAIQYCLDKADPTGQGGTRSVSYALYPMDKEGAPELIVKYGTCEADYRINIYTYRSGELYTLAEELGGGHTSFAFDRKAHQLVLASGHMGVGNMAWYDIDDDGKLRFLIDTGELAYSD